MNLLLLLSALLSALSGVGQAVRGGARGPEMVCASIAGLPVAAAPRRVVASRPVQPPPSAVVTAIRLPDAWRLLPAEPIFAGRRRE